MIWHIKCIDKDPKKNENNFIFPCYGFKIFIPSNKSQVMNIKLPFSLLVLFTVFSGLSCYTAFQSHSFQYKNFCINNNAQKEPACLTIIKSYSYSVNKNRKDIAGIAEVSPAIKHPAGTPGNLMADNLIKNENCNRVICLSQPGDPYKNGNNARDENPVKETSDVGVITDGYTPGFFDNLITYKYKKGDDIFTNQVGRAGIFLDRLDFEFTKFSGKKLANSQTISVSQKTRG